MTWMVHADDMPRNRAALNRIGAAVLSDLTKASRVKRPPQDQTAYFEDAYPDDDCGCPVEQWVVCGVTLQIHFEPDGTMEVYADTGDWDCNLPLKATTMSAGRDEAFAWARALPTEDEIYEAIS